MVYLCLCVCLIIRPWRLRLCSSSSGCLRPVWSRKKTHRPSKHRSWRPLKLCSSVSSMVKRSDDQPAILIFYFELKVILLCFVCLCFRDLNLSVASVTPAITPTITSISSYLQPLVPCYVPPTVWSSCTSFLLEPLFLTVLQTSGYRANLLVTKWLHLRFVYLDVFCMLKIFKLVIMTKNWSTSRLVVRVNVTHPGMSIVKEL